jgi:hypothetical protein
VIVLAATSEDVQDDLENEFDESNEFSVRLAAVAARLALRLAC